MRTLVENVELMKQARDKLRNALVEKGLSEEDVNSLNSLVDIIAGLNKFFPYGLSGDVVVPSKFVVDMTDDENFVNANYMFYHYNFTSLTLPDGFGENITSTRYMFSNCDKLT